MLSYEKQKSSIKPLADDAGTINVLQLASTFNAGFTAAVALALPKIGISGAHTITPMVVTLAVPTTLTCHDAVLTRTGAASSSIVLEINANGNAITQTGSLLIDAADNAPEALRFTNTGALAGFTCENIAAINVYTRVANGAIGANSLSIMKSK